MTEGRHGTGRRRMILGPEVWRVDDHATWTHWDLWFCAVWAADFGGDRASFAAELRRRHDRPFGCPDWESFLSHLDDLEARLAAGALTPAAVAADSLGDKTIMAKARRKVLEQGLSTENLTPAMIDTPRARLGRRALRGRWDQFPVSPVPAYERFSAVLAKRDADRSRRYGLARPLSALLDRLERAAGNDPAQRLAVHRAFLAAGLEAMDRNLGSHAVVELLEMSLLKYVAIPWREAGMVAEDYFQDLCELLVWESYALTDEHETTIFERIPPKHGDLVASILDALGAEHRRHGLTHHACRAAENAAYLAVARGRLAGMVGIAEALGPDGWIAVKRMTEAALAAGRRDIALALFAAADRPGTLRDNLRSACLDLLHEEPEQPHLRLER